MNGAQHKIVGIGFGIGAYLLLSDLGMPLEGAVTAVASVGGSLLPDIDHDNTKIGRKRKFVTNVTAKTLTILMYGACIVSAVLLFLIIKQGMDFGVNPMMLVGGIIGIFFLMFLQRTVCNSKTYKWAAKHRGLMHTLLPAAAILFVVYSTKAPVIRYTALGVVVGYMSHLIADMFTVAGCPILFPLIRANIRIMRFESKDSKLNTVAVILAAVAVVGCYYLAKIL